jgi:outer membrane autotransporter protein
MRIRGTDRMSMLCERGRLACLALLALSLLPLPATAGSGCTLTVVGGQDQAVVPDSQLSLPMRVRYDSNGFGPANIDVRFYHCEGESVLFDLVSPGPGSTDDLTINSVPDGGEVEVLGYAPAALEGFAFVCVEAIDKDSMCFGSTGFFFDVVDFQLGTDNANPTGFVGQPLNLTVSTTPPTEFQRIVWEVTGGTGSLATNETETAPGGASSNSYTSFSPGQATVKAWLGAGMSLAGKGAAAQRGLVTFGVTILQRMLAIVGGDGQVGVVNEVFPDPLTVRVTTNDGTSTTPESGVDVEFFIKDMSGAVLVDPVTGNVIGTGDFAVVTTNGSGEARIGLRAGPDPGPILVCVSDVEGQASGDCFNLSAVEGPPPELVIVSGNNQGVFPGQTFAPLVVGSDPPGAFGSDFEVFWEVVSGSATIDGSSSATSPFVGGTASIEVDAGQAPGPVLVRATLSQIPFSAAGSKGLVTQSVDFSLNVIDPVPPVVEEMIEISGNGQSAQPGEVFANPLVVQVLRDGEPVPGVTVRWERISGTGLIEPDGGNRVDLQSEADGTSSIFVRAPAQPGTTQIRADADGFGAVIFTLTASEDAPPPPPGVNLQLTLVSGDNQSGAVGTRSDAPIVVRLTSIEEEPVPVADMRIDWSVVSGNATLAAPSSLTDTDGLASMTFTYGAPGPIFIRARIQSANTMVTVRATSFQPTLSILSGDGQSGPVSTELPLPLVVATAPPGLMAKGLAGVPVTWTVIEGGGALASTSTETGTDGSSANRLTLGPSPGVNRVRAEIAGSPPVVFTATAVAGAGEGAVLTIVSGDGQTLPTNQLSAPLVVELTDSQGNPIPNVNLRWIPGPDSAVEAELEFTSTGADGRASNRARALRPGRQFVRVFVPADPVTLQLDFVINAGIINTSGLNEREREVAGRLDDVCARMLGIANPTPEQQDLIAICRGLVDSSGQRPGEVREVLRQIIPDEVLTAGRIGLQMGSAQFDNLKARLAALRGGTGGVSFGGLALRGDNGTMPLGFLDTLLLGKSPDDEVGVDFSRWAFFISGNFGRGSKSITERESGFKFDSWSITAGVDYRYSDTLVMGLAAGYNRSETDLRGAAGSLDSRGYSASLYSTWYRESYFLDSVLTLGRNDFDLDRTISFTLTGPDGPMTFSQVARSKTDGNQYALAISGGRDFNRDGWTFGPYVRAMLARQKIDGFTESIALPGRGSGLAFRVDDRSLKSRAAVLGGKVNYAMSTSWGILLPHLQVEYQREFQDDEQEVIVRLLHDPGATPFILRGERVDRDFLNIGLGVSAVFASGRSAFIFYERTSGLSNQKRENLALGLRIEF